MSQLNDLLKNSVLSGPSYNTCLPDILEFLEVNSKTE